MDPRRQVAPASSSGTSTPAGIAAVRLSGRGFQPPRPRGNRGGSDGGLPPDRQDHDQDRRNTKGIAADDGSVVDRAASRSPDIGCQDADPNPSVVVLALGFLLMFGMTPMAEGTGAKAPMGNVYAAMAFSALVETINTFARRARRSKAAATTTARMPVRR